MKEVKIWIYVEQYDTETEEYKDINEHNPIPAHPDEIVLLDPDIQSELDRYIREALEDK